MKVFNYIRSSSKEQNEQYQIDAMKQFNKENGFDNTMMMIDKQTGTNTDRPQLQTMIASLEADHKLEEEHKIKIPRLVVINAIDRLSRNYNECLELWKQIVNTGADIVVLDMPLLDTRKHKDLLGTFISDLILQVLAYVAQQETEFRSKRQQAGIEAMPVDETTGKKYSIKTGNPTGRPCAELPTGFEAEYQAWKRGEQKATETFKKLGLTKTTFYKLVKQYEAQQVTE